MPAIQRQEGLRSRAHGHTDPEKAKLQALSENHKGFGATGLTSKPGLLRSHPQMSRICITWEIVTSANPWAPVQTNAGINTA